MRNTIDLPAAQETDASTLLDVWLQHLKADRSPATIRRYQSAVRRFLTWYESQEHRPLAIEDLTPIALVGYRNALQKTEAPSTVNTHLSALRAWCRWLVETRHLMNDPAARVKLVGRQSPSAPQPLKAAEANAPLPAPHRSRH